MYIPDIDVVNNEIVAAALSDHHLKLPRALPRDKISRDQCTCGLLIFSSVTNPYGRAERDRLYLEHVNGILGLVAGLPPIPDLYQDWSEDLHRTRIRITNEHGDQTYLQFIISEARTSSWPILN